MSIIGKRFFTYFFWILTMLSTTACTKRVCPAYFSTFNQSPDAANKFFSYFEVEEVEGAATGNGGADDGDVYASSDSFFDDGSSADPDKWQSPTEAYVPKRDSLKTPNGMLIFQDGDEPSKKKLMAGRTRTKTGLVKQPNLISRIFTNPDKRRAKNRPKIVIVKTKPQKGAEADSTELPYPPEYFEQYYYEIGLGKPDRKLAAETDSLQEAPPEEAALEAEEGYEYVTDKKGRTKKKKIKKKKGKKAKQDEGNPAKDEPKKPSKKQKKKKKDDEENDDESAS